MRMRRTWRRYLGWAAAACLGSGVAVSLADPPGTVAPARHSQPAPGPDLRPLENPPNPKGPAASALADDGLAEEGATLAAQVGPEEVAIDLGNALRLGGVANPRILLARQRVVEAVALRQFAAAQLLPSLHMGASYDDHNGNLQQSSGNILKVDRNSVYFGFGANAIAAGTVNVPGVFWMGNPSEAVFGFLSARQLAAARGFASRAVENEMLRRIGITYTELLRAEGRRAVARRLVEEARHVQQITENFARFGQGKKADADRAATERQEREATLLLHQGETLIVSARLAELLNLPPTTRLRAVDDKVIPCQLVPPTKPLPELIAIALLNRPELMERQALIRQAMLSLQGAKVLPFSPNLIIAFSYGGEAGGSNLVAEPFGTNLFAKGHPRFGRSAERTDFDAVAYWMLENLALGNKARIDFARARLGTTQLEWLEQLNRVRAQVANAYARAHARFAQIGITEEAVLEAMKTFAADSEAVAGLKGRPIELLESLRLLARARFAYLDAIVDYNEAELDLFVALGQPPPEALARPVPTAPPPAVTPEILKTR
jgi:outer membrane protein TolC